MADGQDLLNSGTDLTRLLYLVNKAVHDHWHLFEESPPGDGPTSDVRELSAKQKEIGRERLGEMLDALFPGKDVTVTAKGGEVLHGDGSEEKEEESKDEE